VCSAHDSRQRSSHPAIGRLVYESPLTGELSAGCTAFIIDRAPADDPLDRCLVTAGHCLPGILHVIVEFEPIPDSVNCRPRRALSPDKRFPVGPALFVNEAAGNDWAVFRAGRNARGKTVFEEQGAQFALAAEAATGPVYKYGYGADGDPGKGDPLDDHCLCDPNDTEGPKSQTQQTSRGAVITVRYDKDHPYLVVHDLHTCGGDSGAPIVSETTGAIVAIHTAPPLERECRQGIPRNFATAIEHAELQAAIAALCGGPGGLVRSSGGDALGLAPPGDAGHVLLDSGVSLLPLPGGPALVVPQGATQLLPGGTIDADRVRIEGTLVLLDDTVLRVPGSVHISGTISAHGGTPGIEGADLTILSHHPVVISGTIDTSGRNGLELGPPPQGGGHGGNVTIRTSSPAPIIVPTIIARGGDADRNDTHEANLTFGGGLGGHVRIHTNGGDVVFGGTVLPPEQVDPLPPQPGGATTPSQTVFQRGILTTGGYGGLAEPLLTPGRGALQGAPGGAGGNVEIACPHGGRVTFTDTQLFTGGNVERSMSFWTSIQGGTFPRINFTAPNGSLGGRGQDSSGDCGGIGGPGGSAGNISLTGCTLNPAPASFRIPPASSPLFNLTDWTFNPPPLRAPIVEASDAEGNPLFTIQAFGGSGGLPGGSLKKTGICSTNPFLPCSSPADCVCPPPGCRIPPCQIVPVLGCVCPPPEPCLCLGSASPECPGTYGPGGAEGPVTCNAFGIPAELGTGTGDVEPVVCAADESCDDGNSCTDDSVDPAAGCMHSPVPGRACDDAKRCTIGDSCTSDGVCTGVPVACSDDGNPCTHDVCNPATGRCGIAVPDGTRCPDERFCNGVEVCQSANCEPGEPLVCPDDGNPCTDDVCNEATNSCGVDRPDGTKCADALFCNGEETCAGGHCQAGIALSCPDDGNPCTEDTCNEAIDGCGIPVAEATPCPDENRCNGDEACHAGLCAPGPAPLCEDANSCTTDGCEPSTGCTFTPTSGTACDDRNPCTTHDACHVSGACAGAPVPNGTCCSDADACNGLELCQLGTCLPGTRAADGTPCDDGNSCTRDERCEAGACGGPPVADGTPCDDGDPCTLGERCAGAVCAGGSAAPDGMPCDDDDSCTVAEACTAGRCGGGLPQADGTPCVGGCDGGRVCSEAALCLHGECRGGPGSDADEDGLCDPLDPCPLDRDCDDDGIVDGARSGSEDLDNDGVVDPGETDPLDPDTDDDGLPDGLERGFVAPEDVGATDLAAGHFAPDLDPSTRTNPTTADTDGDGLLDGQEDANRNGRVDPGESDPLAASPCVTDCPTTTTTTLSTSSSSTTSTSTTTSTTSITVREACDDCVDNNGDGAVDLADPTCPSAGLVLDKASIHPGRQQNRHRVTVTARATVAGFLPDLPDGIRLTVRSNLGALLPCEPIPANEFKSKTGRRGMRFRLRRPIGRIASLVLASRQPDGPTSIRMKLRRLSVLSGTSQFEVHVWVRGRGFAGTGQLRRRGRQLILP
jgi:hypothetical protein